MLGAPPTPETRVVVIVEEWPCRVETGMDKLAGQVAQTVQWADCLQACLEAGATAFQELGPGAALSEMVASTYPGVPSRSVDEFTTLGGLRAWLLRQAG